MAVAPPAEGVFKDIIALRGRYICWEGVHQGTSLLTETMTAPEREKSSALISDSLKSGTQTLPHTRGGCEVLKEMTKLGECMHTDSGRRNVVENSTGWIGMFKP